jgi:Uncharacterized enzyme of heme biosynthesis
MTTNEKKESHRPWLRWIAGFLAVSVVLFLWIAGQLIWHTLQTLKTNQQILDRVVTQVQRQWLPLQNQVNHQQQSVNEWLHQANASRVQIRCTQAAYWVTQATYQLKLAQPDRAVWLLNNGLNELNSITGMESVKNKLSQVMGVLKNTPTVDRLAIIQPLDQLTHQVMQLPLRLPGNVSTAKIDSEKSGLPIWQQIKQLVVIRHHDKPIEPLLSPLQDFYLKQNLQLQLEQAEVAVLLGDATLYRFTLEKMTRWVKQFFVTDAKETQVVLQTLNQLQQVNIAPATPAVWDTLHTVLIEIKSSIES